MKTFLSIFFGSMLSLAAEFAADAVAYEETRRYWFEMDVLLVSRRYY